MGGGRVGEGWAARGDGRQQQQQQQQQQQSLCDTSTAGWVPAAAGCSELRSS